MDKLYISIYQEDLYFIEKLTQISPNIETGGDLFGHFKFHNLDNSISTSACDIEKVIGPGKLATKKTYSFKQSTLYLRKHLLLKCFFGNLEYIGIWHSHHTSGVTELSPADIASTKRYMRKYHYDHFISVLSYYDMLLSKIIVKPYLFTTDELLEYFESEYSIDFIECEWNVLNRD